MNIEFSRQAGTAIREKFASDVIAHAEFRDEITVVVNASVVHEVISFAKDYGYDLLLDISSVDNLGSQRRFEVVYELTRISDDAHLRIKASLAEGEPIASICDIWPAANWHEREVFDMMGIEFSKHPDLRKILMWDGYPYNPLLKDFPLAGKPTELPEVAFTETAPMAGGPFVATCSGCSSKREPQARGES